MTEIEAIVLLTSGPVWFHWHTSPNNTKENDVSQSTFLLYADSKEAVSLKWLDLWISGTARRSNQSILKDVSPEYLLEGLMLKLKLQYFGHLMGRTDSLEKTPDAGKDWGQEEKGLTEDEMVGWRHRLSGHEFEQALGVGDGQGSLASCSPRGSKKSDMPEQLNWTETTTISNRMLRDK